MGKVLFAVIILYNAMVMGYAQEKTVKLPRPRLKGLMSVEEALDKRKSVRNYQKASISLADAGQLLWAAQGGTSGRNRTAPSAGATYPMETYLIAGEVQGIEAGVYHYSVSEHTLRLIKAGDIRPQLQNACLGQPMITNAPLSILLDAVSERTTRRYGDRGIRYIHMEAGHIGQNIYLQAETLGFGTVAVGAFRDEDVKKIIPELKMPLYIYPVGKN